MNSKLSESQAQTEETFGFKWKKRETYESESVQREWRRWLFEKYLDGDESRLESLLAGGRKRILDAGCGSGGSSLLFFGDYLKEHEYVGVDISEAVEVARERFEERGIPASFYQADLNAVLEELGSFDVIFSEGVLHHTDSVGEAIASLAKRLRPDGLFFFYVYAKKAPIREYTDDLVREAVSKLGNEEAWEALKPLTLLGKSLGELGVEIEVPEDVPFLGIEKGKYDLQRFFYYKICKAFFRKEYTINEMNHINFDWFMPQNCHRHTPEEVRGFCRDAGLNIERMYVEDSGISVIAVPK